MATPAYIKARVEDGLIKCVRLNKFPDGYSCAFEFNEKGKKALYPSTGKQPTRIWKSCSEVLTYIKDQIGWAGPIYNEHLDQIQ